MLQTRNFTGERFNVSQYIINNSIPSKEYPVGETYTLNIYAVYDRQFHMHHLNILLRLYRYQIAK